jgi:hypothetical protein
MVIKGFLVKSIHHRGTEFAEIGEFFQSRTLYSASSAPQRCNLRLSSQESLKTFFTNAFVLHVTMRRSISDELA